MLRYLLVLLLTLQIALAPMVQAAQGAVDNVSIAGNIAESGFENNYLTHREQQILVNLLACEHGEVCENEETITKEDLMARDAERDQVLANCEGDYSATCTNARRDLYIALAEYADAQEKNPSLREDATFTWFMSRTALMYAQYADINDFDTEDGTPLISPEDYDSDIALGILNYDIYLALGLATPGTQIAAAETDAGMPLGLLAGMLRLFRGGVIGTSWATNRIQGLSPSELTNQRLLDDVGGDQAAAIWGRISSNYASQASGNVTAIVNNPRSSSIFLTQGLPTLLQNPNVTQVTVRSVSGAQVTIPRGTSINDALGMIEGF